VLRHVLANGSASFQSHPNHANTFRPNPADRAIPHTKDLRAKTGSFGAFKPNTFTCARFFFISRARERVWKGICHFCLLAFAGMIGREGSSRLHLGSRDGRPVGSRETPTRCSRVALAASMSHASARGGIRGGGTRVTEGTTCAKATAPRRFRKGGHAPLGAPRGQKRCHGSVAFTRRGNAGATARPQPWQRRLPGSTRGSQP